MISSEECLIIVPEYSSFRYYRNYEFSMDAAII